MKRHLSLVSAGPTYPRRNPRVKRNRSHGSFMARCLSLSRFSSLLRQKAAIPYWWLLLSSSRPFTALLYLTRFRIFTPWYGCRKGKKGTPPRKR